MTAPEYRTGKICYIEIPATDVERSADFYHRAFGWSIRRRGDGATAFDDTVNQVSGTWVLGRPPTSGAGLLVYIMASNASDAAQAVTAAGGEIVRPIDPDAREVHFTFQDPGGNVMGVYQQPGLEESTVSGPITSRGMELDRLDHVVFTVRDLDGMCDFYSRALGMTVVTSQSGPRALQFGRCKINLHQYGHEFEPKAAQPGPGTQDICLVTSTALDRVVEHLESIGVDLVEGPVPRTGALGAMESVYVRDPEGNLVEIAHYGATDPF